MHIEPAAAAALDAMDEIAACWRAISALVAPDDRVWDTQARSDLSILTDKLARDYDAARQQFTAAMRRAA